MSTRRLYVVGTGTGVGKTAVICALLREAAARDRRILPFKPVQSGPDDPSDAERLAAAAPLAVDASDICPVRFDPPVAPGIADDPDPFFERPRPSTRTAVPPEVVASLERLEATHQPELILVEGAGGVHVPMPGGTWQPTWIRLLAPRTLVVGDADLGTINHCLLTIDALVDLGCPPLGFYLSATRREPDPSRELNARVVAAARNVPHLGTLPHRESPPTSLLSPLLRLL